MKLKQLSLFLENKPGTLSEPVRLLARHKCNILALSIAEAREFGILRLILRDWEHAAQLLEKNGFVVKVTELVAVEVPDGPGGLAEILAPLGESGVNLEYMYGFTLPRENKGLLLFRFDDPGKAIAALQKAGANVRRSTDLFDRLEA